MKIYDIISEATAPVVAPATAPKTVRRAKPTPAAPPPAKKAPALSSAGKLVDKYILTKKLHGTVITSRMAQALGGYLRIIKYLGFYEIAQQLWQQKIAIDMLIAEGQIPKEEGAALYRQQLEKFAIVIMGTAAFGNLLSKLKYIPIIKWFVRLAAGAATVGTAGMLGGPAVMSALATEVGLIFLTKYLATNEGQKALAYWVANIIDPGVVWLWNEGPGKIFGAWKTASDTSQAKADSTIKGKASVTGANQAANPAQATAPGQAANPAIDATSTEKDQSDIKASDIKSTDTKWGVGNKYSPSLNKNNAIQYDPKSVRTW